MGAVQILTHSMVQSIEENSVRKGFDPRDFALVAEGGAGPLFAAQIALEVGTPNVARPAVPRRHGGHGPPGHGHGLRVRRHVVPAPLGARRGRARAALRGARGGGAAPARGRTGSRPTACVIQRVVDARYAGQGYELRVDVGSGAIDEAWTEKLRADFHDIHEREYSRRFEESDIEVPNIRVRGVGLMPPLEDRRGRARRRGAARGRPALRGAGVVPGRRRAAGGRDQLLRPRVPPGGQPAPGARRSCTSTTRRPSIPPGLTATIDGYGNIVIATGGAARAEALEAAEAVEV